MQVKGECNLIPVRPPAVFFREVERVENDKEAHRRNREKYSVRFVIISLLPADEPKEPKGANNSFFAISLFLLRRFGEHDENTKNRFDPF